MNLHFDLFVLLSHVTFLSFSIYVFFSLEYQLAALTAGFALFANCRTGTNFVLEIVVLDQDPNHFFFSLFIQIFVPGYTELFFI